MENKLLQESNENKGTSFLSQTFLTKKYIVIPIAIFCCLLWGSGYPALKISYLELGITVEDIGSKILLAGIRFFLASILMFIFVSISFKERKKINSNKLKNLFLLGILQTTLNYFFFYNGLGNAPAVRGAILASTTSFFVVIIAHFVYKNDKINLGKVIGIVTGFLGIIFVNAGRGGFGGAFTFNGEGYLLMTALINATAIFAAKYMTKTIHPFILNAWQLFFGSIVLMGWGIISTNGKMLNFTPKAILILIYTAFLSAIAFSLWYLLLQYNKAGEIGIYRFMIPVSGSLLSAIFLVDEILNLNIIFSLMLVSIGIVVINYKPKKSTNKVTTDKLEPNAIASLLK